MRNIDYWVGVPVCFLLTLWDRFKKLFLFFFHGNTKAETPSNNILFIKLSELGSIILADACIQDVTKQHPKSTCYFLTFKKNKEIFYFLNTVDPANVFCIRKNSVFLFVVDVFKCLLEIRKLKLSLCVDLEFFSRFSAIFTYLSGATKRVGFYRYQMEGLYRGELLTHKVEYNPHQHISSSYRSLAYASIEDIHDQPHLDKVINLEGYSLPTINIPQSFRERLFGILRQKNSSLISGSIIYLISPGDGVSLLAREWAVSCWVDLIKKLLKQNNVFIVLVGENSAKKKTGYILQSVGDSRCVDLSGELCLGELFSLFVESYMLVCNDSGIAHLASLTNTSTIVIFGPETPAIYRPLGSKNIVLYKGLSCSPCVSAFTHKRTSCQDNQCLKLISADEVYAKILEVGSNRGNK